nr:MAG TPA: hypothetical protein [Caudoviricetes sp.]
MRSREKNREKDIKTNKIKMNTDIVKPNIGELTKAKKTLEKAKELNRKVKFVPMGYSPSWEREKEVIEAKKEQIDKSTYTPKGGKIHVPEGYLKVKDLREKFLEKIGSYVTRLDMEYRSRVNEIILGSAKAYEWNEEIFNEITSNYKRKKRYKK